MRMQSIILFNSFAMLPVHFSWQALPDLFYFFSLHLHPHFVALVQLPSLLNAPLHNERAFLLLKPKNKMIKSFWVSFDLIGS